MSLRKSFPRTLAACFALTLAAAHVVAQAWSRPRQVGAPARTTPTTTAAEADGRTRLENDVFVIPTAPAGEDEPEAAWDAVTAPFGLGQTEQMLLAAIDARMGVPYRLGTQGPKRYDCSGFVWSVFQAAGFDFERSSARMFWHQFEPVSEEEKFKFGTLVFFNRLNHIGIVAGGNGFYHASSSRGVTYSPFNDYWTKRISGFRRIPVPPLARTQVAFSGR